MAHRPKTEAFLDFLSRFRKELIVFSALALTLAFPFLLRPSDRRGKIDAEIVVITPHNESIRAEFSRAFTLHMKETTGQNIHIDWRTPGGTAEISKTLDSAFKAAIEFYRKQNPQIQWDDVTGAFHHWKNYIPPSAEEIKALPPEERKAIVEEQIFLHSDIGVGIDLFFGGGAYDFSVQSKKHRLVAGDPESETGVAGVAARHPDWFSDKVIPESAGGEPYIDFEKRWVGTCLSAFGIVYNRDILNRIGIQKEPTTWTDLTSPSYFRQIALADPSKSGSVNKAFEMLIQQQMHLAVADAEKKFPDKDPVKREDDAIRVGWNNAMVIILKIGANARYFTDSATKIPLDVSRGDAAAGMCIDFYGRTFVDRLKTLHPGVQSRVGYITPAGGTSVGVDPIGLLRGAPNPALATSFIEFVLSPQGQQIWGFKKGVPGGPVKTALHRLPIRKDIYAGESAALLSHPEVLPYEQSQRFEYRPEWTGRAFNSIRFLIRVMCVDTHDELAEAWEEVYRENFPKKATATLLDLRIISYDNATGSISDVLKSDNKLRHATMAKELGNYFRDNYATAAQLARKQL